MAANNSDSGAPTVGRVALVTGATSGIGRQVAIGLAARGATTVLIGRGEERTSRIAAEIARQTGNPSVESLPVADLALLSEMRHLADEVLRRYPQVHILVNNAAAFFAKREVTADGLERTFALNVMAPFVLTSLLTGRLRESAPARVVQVASRAHKGYEATLEDLQSSAGYRGFQVYGRSKLELILLTREFARRLQGSGVTVNAVHPGWVRSGFAKNSGGVFAFGLRSVGLLMGRSEWKGAQTPLFVAIDPSVAPISGEYFSNRRISRSSGPSRDMVTARRLFAVCAELSGVPELPDPASKLVT